jgi:phage shock protein PspC (stress-responsive transcriptional regulator)
MFAGVAGGIAEYLEVDPTLVRLVFVALTLLSSGSGLIIYIVLMLIVPEQPRYPTKAKNEDHLSDAVVRSSTPVSDATLEDETEETEA